MPEQSDLLMYGVAVAAFVVGYILVGFVIKHLKALKERPPLNEELWRQHEQDQKDRPAPPEIQVGNEPEKPGVTVRHPPPEFD